MMTKQNQYISPIAIPPGETLKEYMEYSDMKQTELADRIGLSTKQINLIINGKAPITQDTAIKLESVFGTPASFWNNLEANYQETIARLEAQKKIEDEIIVAKLLPYSELSKLGFVKPTKIAQEKVVNLRSFFGIASLDYIPNILSAAFRVKQKNNVSPYALATWLRMGEILAGKTKTESYDEKKLKSLIPKFRELTLSQLENSRQELVELCSSCGIALVFVPHLQQTFVHGAVKWLTPTKVLIQLSSRGAYTDIFWFSFFHELGHILLHGKKNTFIEVNGKDEFENQADSFAIDTLIPSKEYSIFIKNAYISRTSISEFADSIGINPCIIVGRLQHDGVVKHNEYNELRAKLC